MAKALDVRVGPNWSPGAPIPWSTTAACIATEFHNRTGSTEGRQRSSRASNRSDGVLRPSFVERLAGLRCAMSGPYMLLLLAESRDVVPDGSNQFSRCGAVWQRSANGPTA